MQFPELKYYFDFQQVNLDNNISVAYRDEGSGEHTILFIHGLASYNMAWKENIDYLKQYFRCIAIDLPGYGKSAAGVYSGSMIFYTEIIVNFINKLELKNVILCGHSMGGQIAATLAIKYPDKCEKLILVAPAGFEIFDNKEIEWIKDFFTPDYTYKTNDEQIRFNYQINFENMPISAEKMIADRINMKKFENFRFFCQIVSNSFKGMLDYPVFDKLSEISIPTLVLFGYQDKLIPNQILHKDKTPFEIAKSGSAEIKNSKLVMLENCGHFVQLDKLEQVNQEILDFILNN